MNKNLFNSVQLTKPSDNVFDLSHDVKLSFNMGELVPVHCMDIIPGDQITMSCETMIRLAPMLAPIMHRVDVTVHFFFVPNRIIWPNWEEFMAWDNSPGAPAVPYLMNTVVTKSNLPGYLGLPLAPGEEGIDLEISAFAFAAYNKIFNEYYRDENLVAEVVDELVDGLNDFEDFADILIRAWEHDYFTAALPWAQKGDPVSLPIGNIAITAKPFDGDPGYWRTIDGSNFGNTVEPLDVSGSTLPVAGSTVAGKGVFYDPAGTLEGVANSTTINDLRKAFRLQEFLEKDALGGTRYTELIRAHFGVVSSDARMQRPEYLGGIKAPVVISEVLQTSSTDFDNESPQGNMAGHGISVGTGRGFSKFFEEHGILMGIMSVLPKTGYQQGIPRSFRKFDKYDFYWPEFAHIGEQAIENCELYYVHSDAANTQTFGYVPRYSEYKYMPNRVAGDFRTDLSYWHMSRIFSSRPSLNASFVTSDPTHRIFAVTDPSDDKLYAHVFHRIKARRKMPFYGTPSF